MSKQVTKSLQYVTFAMKLLYKIYRKLMKYFKKNPPLIYFVFRIAINRVLHSILISFAADCVVYYGLAFQIHLKKKTV